MRFPLDEFTWPGKEGQFGTARKHDIHTGIDLYCRQGEEIYAIEAGVVVKYDWFTGERAEPSSPWWNNTLALAIKGKSGVIVYGELTAYDGVHRVGTLIREGETLGRVEQVLKEDKGKVPSTSMLHLELYKEYPGFWHEWELCTYKPENLLDPTPLLIQILQKDKIKNLFTNENI